MVQWGRERCEDWSRRSAQKLHCCLRNKEYPTTRYQTHRVVGDARDIRHLHQFYHQSTETRRTTKFFFFSESEKNEGRIQKRKTQKKVFIVPGVGFRVVPPSSHTPKEFGVSERRRGGLVTTGGGHHFRGSTTPNTSHR